MLFKPRFAITPKINKILLEIERVRGFLDAAQLKEKWIKGMQSEMLIIESHHSTHIEGTQLTLSQAKKILTGKKVSGIDPNDKKELLNYKRAMGFVSKFLGKEDPITEGLIRDIHKILIKGVRGNSADPGNYRKIQNYVVNANNQIIYTPPSSHDVPHLMSEFVKWLNSPKDSSAIITSGIAQFQFVHIHPFIDGNGRTARLICTLILYKNGYDFKKLFSLSEYYDKNRKRYYEAIQSVRKNNMDMTAWLEYFTNALKAQMLEVKDKGETIIKKEIYLEKAKKVNLNERQINLLLYIIGKKRVTVDECIQKFNIIRRTVQRDFSFLVDHKFVREIAKSKTDPTKYYELL
jgi:Fic family protein